MPFSGWPEMTAHIFNDKEGNIVVARYVVCTLAYRERERERERGGFQAMVSESSSFVVVQFSRTICVLIMEEKGFLFHVKHGIF
ncbi:hypothetical protein HPP92_014344 [Vanilla planifolia]|uniref:Uncharacterized protein n=1 Tax=Vanilla planifolia TaxID=51239 RepID=A0A835QN53_VANPL|nr:hypothetical protein HPP92_014344 [Vanilla planifolia]